MSSPQNIGTNLWPLSCSKTGTEWHTKLQHDRIVPMLGVLVAEPCAGAATSQDPTLEPEAASHRCVGIVMPRMRGNMLTALYPGQGLPTPSLNDRTKYVYQVRASCGG
jgi:hypothetical protein